MSWPAKKVKQQLAYRIVRAHIDCTCEKLPGALLRTVSFLLIFYDTGYGLFYVYVEPNDE